MTVINNLGGDDEPMSTVDIARQTMVDQLTNAVDFYNQPPAEDEINLVAKARQILFESGVEETRLIYAYDNHRFVVEAMGKHAHAQQFLLNRWLNEQFMHVDTMGGDSRLYRYQLVYEIRPTQWLTILKNSVAPNFAELGLPLVDVSRHAEP